MQFHSRLPPHLSNCRLINQSIFQSTYPSLSLPVHLLQCAYNVNINYSHHPAKSSLFGRSPQNSFFSGGRLQSCDLATSGGGGLACPAGAASGRRARFLRRFTHFYRSYHLGLIRGCDAAGVSLLLFALSLGRLVKAVDYMLYFYRDKFMNIRALIA